MTLAYYVFDFNAFVFNELSNAPLSALLRRHTDFAILKTCPNNITILKNRNKKLIQKNTKNISHVTVTKCRSSV